MVEKVSDLQERITSLYRKLEASEGEIRIFKGRHSICLRLLQNIIDSPQQSKILARKAIDSLRLNTLILIKTSPESSPNCDHWTLQGLSYKTSKEYFPALEMLRDYQHENNYVLLSIFDQRVADKLTEKMTQRNDHSWEYIGHVRDLIE